MYDRAAAATPSAVMISRLVIWSYEVIHYTRFGRDWLHYNVQLWPANNSVHPTTARPTSCGFLVFFTALHVMQTRYSEENSVCPSVRPSVTRVIPDKREERSVQIFIPYERIFILVFREEEWLVGGDPFYLKFWVKRPPLERNRRFSTNNRS